MISHILTKFAKGGEKYQSAFYVYEELASNPNSTAPMSIVGQAIAELHLGRFPEAEAALTAALEKYPEGVELIANTIVLNVLTGKDTTELTSYVAPIYNLGNVPVLMFRYRRLESLQPSHALITDLAEKSSFFDTAAAKYVPKLSS
jgi:coatomer protein complex subunit epsilon